MIEFRIKEKTRSLNLSFRGDWRPRAAAAKRQRIKAMQACPKWPGGPLLVVRLTRVSPRTLDFGNLAGALKHVQDGVASRLKVDDASPLVEWRFEQATGDAEVVVQIWKAGEAVPAVPVGRPVEKRRSTKAERIADRLRGMGMGVTVVMDGEKKRAPRPSHIARGDFIPSASAEYRGMVTALEAEETFAPGLRCDKCGVDVRAMDGGRCTPCVVEAFKIIAERP